MKAARDRLQTGTTGKDLVLYEMKDCLGRVFEYLDPYSVGRCSCVCKAWFHLPQNHIFELCSKAVYVYKNPKVEKRFNSYVKEAYGGDWRRFYLEYPHFRFDGIYVLSVFYFTPGNADPTVPNQLSYYRYVRFYPDRTFDYVLSNDEPEKGLRLVAKRSPKVELLQGTYRIKFDKETEEPCIKATVDNGHLILKMTLSMHEFIPQQHDRLELTSIHGIDHETQDLVRIRSNCTLFRFYWGVSK